MRPVGQEAKTPPSHGGNRGSIPLRVTTENPLDSVRRIFCIRLNIIDIINIYSKIIIGDVPG